MSRTNGKTVLPPVNDLHLDERGFSLLEKTEEAKVYYNNFNNSAWYIYHFGGDDFKITEDETVRYFGRISDFVVLDILCSELEIKY